MASSLQIDENELMKNVSRGIDEMLDEIGYVVAAQVEDNISIIGPPRSSPGEYPRVDTGELHGSIVYYVNDGTLTVAAEAPHAVFVEVMRPFLSRTWEEMADQVDMIIRKHTQ